MAKGKTKSGGMKIVLQNWPASVTKSAVSSGSQAIVMEFVQRLDPSCTRRAGALVVARGAITLKRRAVSKSANGGFVINLNMDGTRHSEAELKAFLIRMPRVQTDLAYLLEAAAGAPGIDTDEVVTGIANSASTAAMGFI